MPGKVSFLLQEFGQSDLFRFQMPFIGMPDFHSCGMSSSETAGSGRGADRAGCIEPIQFDSLFRQTIQVRGLDYLVTIKANISPAQVITHDKDDVRSIRVF